MYSSTITIPYLRDSVGSQYYQILGVVDKRCFENDNSLIYAYINNTKLSIS